MQLEASDPKHFGTPPAVGPLPFSVAQAGKSDMLRLCGSNGAVLAVNPKEESLC